MVWGYQIHAKLGHGRLASNGLKSVLYKLLNQKLVGSLNNRDSVQRDVKMAYLLCYDINQSHI